MALRQLQPALLRRARPLVPASTSSSSFPYPSPSFISSAVLQRQHASTRGGQPSQAPRPATATAAVATPPWDIATAVLQHRSAHDPLHATAAPLYQTATFGELHTGQQPYDYTRSGNPTRHSLEALVAGLEGAPRGFAFTSGMAALSAVVRALTAPGDRVVAGEDLYGGMHRLLSYVAHQNGLEVVFADLTRAAAVREAVRPGTRLVFVESPTNPLMKVVDLRTVCATAHAAGALVCVDNSVMSPALMQPHALGADLVVNSATKFLNGHSDVMAGLVTCADDTTADRLAFVQNAEGAGLAPFDAWLVLRGAKTLPLRQRAAQRSAEMLAKFLRGHRLIGDVLYLHPEDARTQPHAQLHFSQARGGGSVLSFVPACGTPDFAQRLLENVRLFKSCVSFGSVHSTIEMPALHSHASIPAEQRLLPDALVRISVGLEDVNDLMADLGRALHETAAREAPQLVEYRLGCPLPAHEPLHACGTAMPKWRDVVGYEEADPRVHKALMCGYPRFVYPPYVVELMDVLSQRFAVPGADETVVPSPSARVALRLQAFIAAASEGAAAARIHDLDFHGMCAVALPREYGALAKAYWQHTGELVSSRLAAEALSHVEEAWPPQAAVRTDGPTDANRQLRRRVAGLLQRDDRDVLLFQSGMAAISSCHRLLLRAFGGTATSASALNCSIPPKRWAVLGFPYLDTLKLLQHPHLSPGAHFLPSGSVDELEALAAREPLLGVITEYPSNPLLKTADLRALRSVADAYGFPIVVDDSIGGFCNVDVLRKGGADILVSSLTKSFSGSGNVMGGSMAFNPASAHYHTLRHYVDSTHEELLFHEDAQILLGNSADLEERNAHVCASAERLAEHLATHPAVQDVFYPKFVNPARFRAFARGPQVRWGGLISLVLRDPRQAAPLYDALPVAKGPGFGTNFTLVCPYTLLAHYHELDFARAAGVDSSLIRVWVGLEPVEELIAAFDRALERAPADVAAEEARRQAEARSEAEAQREEAAQHRARDE